MRLVTQMRTGENLVIRDIGPDIIFVDAEGNTWAALTGRSMSGSGVIGRVLINFDTLEIIRSSGKEVGSLADQICPILAD